MPSGELKTQKAARGRWKRSLLSVSLGAGAVALVYVGILSAGRLWPKEELRGSIDSGVKDAELQTLRKQSAQLESKVQDLTEKTQRLFPAEYAILIDTASNQISLVRGSQVVVQDKCSTGSGMELSAANGDRTWTFDTPRGHFRIVGKVNNPVWYRPDWDFVEQGEPIPKDRASRVVGDVLGAYALAIGDGYFIHGTLYTRMLGSSVTHGCVRVDDDTLKKIYNASRIGTPVWIY